MSNGRHASWQNCREEGRRPRSGKVESQQEHCGDNQDHEGPVAARLGHGRCQYRCVPTRTRSSELNSSTQRPDPRTTERKGSSATRTGTPSSWRMRSSSPRSNAPPPVSTMPRSRMSPESSGGHTSSGPDQLDDLQHRSLDRAAHFWRGDGDRVGQPGREVASCDRMLSSSRKGNAEPAPTLMSWALRSPSSREYSLLTWLMIASSISSPPRRSDLELTMPPRLMTATSVVRHRCPPPCSRRCR